MAPSPWQRTKGRQRVVSEGAGWSGQTLEKAQIWSRQIGSIAVTVVQRDAVVAAWGGTTAKTELASVRKSLLSAPIGNAVERKQMETIGSVGIDDNEKSATARELLQARSGVSHALANS